MCVGFFFFFFLLYLYGGGGGRGGRGDQIGTASTWCSDSVLVWIRQHLFGC